MGYLCTVLRTMHKQWAEVEQAVQNSVGVAQVRDVLLSIPSFIKSLFCSLCLVYKQS